MPKSNSKCGLIRKFSCRCVWECYKLTRTFTKASSSDLRRKEHISLNLEFSSESKRKWCDSAVKNSEMDVSKISNMKRVPVPRRHWSLK